MCGRLTRISIAPPSARSTAASDKAKGRKFAQLSPHEQHDFVNLMRQNKLDGWQGPPGPFVYTVLRSDAVDVVYCHHGRLRRARRALHAPHRADEEVVSMANEKVDVVIVGAGASGSVFASVLAKAGKKVVLLDNGPDWQLTDLISSDIWGRRIKPAGPPVLLEGKNPFGYVGQAGWGVGGAALHYFANFPRYLPTDFKIKSEHNRAHDWPISYEDVAPFYDKVAADIGVSGDAKAEERWRPAGAPYPMPPMKTFPERRSLAQGRRGERHPFRAGRGRHDLDRIQGPRRPASMTAGATVGCPTGALANPVVTYLGEARKANAEVRALSHRHARSYQPDGTRVTGVEYYDAKKQKQVQEASVVILAAWSAQNPRLLLNSATDKHPNGLANSNDLVGKFMMTHHIAGTWALFDEDITPHMGTVGAQFMSYDRYAKTQLSRARSASTFIVAGCRDEDQRLRQCARRSVRRPSLPTS